MSKYVELNSGGDYEEVTPINASSGAAGFVYFRGLNDQVSGAVAGLVFLSTTPGGFSATGASAAGNVVQKIGTAVSATEIAFEPQPICIRV